MKEQDEQLVGKLVNELGLSPLTSRLLINRGLTSAVEAEQFLHIDKGDFYDPFLLDGMPVLVERVRQAIRDQEKILVFGDYDADGVTATAIMTLGLRSMGADVDFYVPHRFTEGYGPNDSALISARESGVSLVITVDTGIAAIGAAKTARAIGLDYIVTDHHEPQAELPDTLAIINPKKPGCLYPFKSLAGAGVAFKVIHALSGEAPNALLDLATVGTVADLVPLLDENRLLVSKGIEILRKNRRPGLAALMAVSSIEPSAIDSDDIGFSIGPRINAAGRMEHAGIAVKLMMTASMADAKALADELDQLNRDRKAVVDQMTVEALSLAEDLPDDRKNILVLARNEWHEGVIGIASSRLVEKYYRPTILFSIDRETGLAKGSARSIEGFDIFQALSKCRDILPRFGGHPMAAGMTIRAEDLDELSQRLNDEAAAVLTDEILAPTVNIDLTCRLQDLTLSELEALNALAPYGEGNPKPTVAIDQAHLADIKRIGTAKNHLKVILKDDEVSLDGVAFKMGELFEQIEPNARLSVMGTMQINEWNGCRKPQILIEDIKVEDWQLFDWRGEQNLGRRLLDLPEDKRLLVYFQEDTVNTSHLDVFSDELIRFDQIHEADQRPYLVLLDVPERLEDLTKLLSDHPFPERIYAVFYHQRDAFFAAVPGRDQFKSLYAVIRQKQTIDVNRLINGFVKARKVRRETVQFMLKVFSDCDFVKIEEGFVQCVMDPEKRPLTSSNTYKKIQERAQVEERLCYSTHRSLKEWLNQFCKKDAGVEEAVYQ
ncbi:single-stranded-DNA-specific exonuclease RecJ [Camelliibacillus cellulosilyticus]|uniref:Single-stranded-DNA-specific exonuclease RecJ n=1 Tax=Camelliibacillus cellulosilyticus TaxID=2174486 RepID=A0ABV9GJG8_9BACL